MVLYFNQLKTIQALFFEAEEELLELNLKNKEKIALSILKHKWINYHTFVYNDIFELENFHKHLSKYSFYKQKYKRYVKNVANYRKELSENMWKRILGFV